MRNHGLNHGINTCILESRIIILIIKISLWLTGPIWSINADVGNALMHLGPGSGHDLQRILEHVECFNSGSIDSWNNENSNLGDLFTKTCFVRYCSIEYHVWGLHFCVKKCQNLFNICCRPNLILS